MDERNLTEKEAKKKFMPFLIVCAVFVIVGLNFVVEHNKTPNWDAGSINSSSTSSGTSSSNSSRSSSTSSGSSSYSSYASSSSGQYSSKKTCPSCGEKVNSLVRREVIRGNGDWQSWCQDCWDNYDSISPYSDSSIYDHDYDYDFYHNYDYDYDYDYDDYYDDYDYDGAVSDIADVYGMSEAEVDAALREVWGY